MRWELSGQLSNVGAELTGAPSRLLRQESHSIRRIDLATGTIHWVGGVPAAELTPAAEKGISRFEPGAMARPHGIWVDQPSGDVFVGDSENHVVLKLTRS